jgi:lysophospholipase L1-like esterase
MLRRILQRAALVFASLALSLGLLEIGLRWSGRYPAVGLHSASARDYERIPGFWEPGQDFVNRQIPALPHRIRTNSLGLRGPETTLAPRGPRVLCLGDSFTFGDYVNDEETLPAQLGARLKGSAEVLNGGIGGTTIVDQREFLERYLALSPDVVLLIYYENDLEDLFLEPPMHVRFARNRELKSGVLGPLYEQVRDTATFNALLHLQGLLRAREVASTPATQQAEGAEPPPWLAPMVERYADEVAALRDRLEAREIELVVAAFPHPFVVSGKYQRDRIAPVSRALAARHIPTVDLTPALRASSQPLTELFLFPHNGHASARAYAIAAEVLEPHVRRALAARRQ